MMCSNGRQVLDCASPLALFVPHHDWKRQKAAALQDAAAPAQVPFARCPQCV